jgi:5-formyltetrahydrofolate cyclo-ligase
MTKKELRKNILNIRDNISKRQCIIKSNKIFNNFKKHIFPAIEKGGVIIYNSFKNEVKTDKIIIFLMNKGYEIYSPCIINKKIMPCKLYSLKNLLPGPYGISEPAKKYRLKSLKKIKTIIIPGIAFDRSGNRLGFGKGYFDKFLNKINKNIMKIGLGFTFQILHKIPSTKNDVKMDIIITDKEIIYVNKKKKNL